MLQSRQTRACVRACVRASMQMKGGRGEDMHGLATVR